MKYLGIEYKTIGNYECLLERRKYSRTYFTWVSIKHGEGWIDLGDPWPVKTPDVSEVSKAANYLLIYNELRALGANNEDASKEAGKRVYGE